MANCVSDVTKMLHLYKFAIPIAMAGQPEKRHNVRAQQQEAVPDWLNLLSLGTMSGSAYIENVA